MWMQYILHSINIPKTRIPIKDTRTTRTSSARLGQQLSWQSGSWLQWYRWYQYRQSPGTKQMESRIQSKISRPIQATAKHGGSYRPNKRRCWWLSLERNASKQAPETSPNRNNTSTESTKWKHPWQFKKTWWPNQGWRQDKLYVYPC